MTDITNFALQWEVPRCRSPNAILDNDIRHTLKSIIPPVATLVNGIALRISFSQGDFRIFQQN
jgi:hypothetical protein